MKLNDNEGRRKRCKPTPIMLYGDDSSASGEGARNRAERRRAGNVLPLPFFVYCSIIVIGILN